MRVTTVLIFVGFTAVSYVDKKDSIILAVLSIVHAYTMYFKDLKAIV